MNDQLVRFMMEFPMIFMVFMKEENALKILEWNLENDAIAKAVINTYLSY
jgi:poly(3-hydroxyalkanoate) synthetase